jgi:hypothetical protein
MSLLVNFICILNMWPIINITSYYAYEYELCPQKAEKV